MRKIALRIIASTLAISISMSSASASIGAAGKVYRIIVFPNGIVMFDHSGQRSALPSCVESPQEARWTFDSTTPAGQGRLAQLLTAYATGAEVIVTGLGTCSDWSLTESINFMEVL